MASAKPSLWRRLFGKPPVPPSLPAPTVEPQHLGSADEVFLAKLVADLAEGKRRDQIGDAQVVHHLDGLWTSGHERLAIEWMEKLLSVPEVPVAATAALRAVLPYARALGLPYVEITTDPDNLASQKVITANGGVLIESFTKPAAFGNAPGLRYRIPL